MHIATLFRNPLLIAYSPSDFIVALSSVDVLSIKPHALKRWSCLQHQRHVSWVQLSSRHDEWLRGEGVIRGREERREGGSEGERERSEGG